MIHTLKNVCKDLKLLLLGLIFSTLLALQPLTPALNQTLTSKSLLILVASNAYAADPPTQTTQDNQTTDPTQNQDTQAQDAQTQDTDDQDSDKPQKDVCRTESGSIGWLICPVINFLAKITDGIYESIETFLVVEPLTFDAQSPYHQIWAIFRDVTNVIFVVFLLIVIYSQLTGLGISNYGVKKALPKVIVAAILINLSYIICAIMVDASNIFGASLRDFFLSVEKTITPSGLLSGVGDAEINYTSLIGYLTGATLLGGLAIATSGGLGTIFLSLIPTLLAAIIAIAIAYITVATRQAMIFLLIMISPLAFVAQILPNTEKHYHIWKRSLTQMLVFYPVFAVLFGACSLIGWVIIASAKSYLFIVLGMAVKIVPLFSAWKLLKMSGTLPGQISATLHGFTRRPLAAISAPLAQEAALKRAKYLAERPRPTQNFRRIAQDITDHRNRRLLDTIEYAKAIKERGAGYAAEITRLDGTITRRGESLYGLIGNSLEASAKISRRNNIYEQGIEGRARNRRNQKQLAREDNRVLTAADDSFMETAYGDWIKANNAIGRRERLSSAVNAHEQSSIYGQSVDTATLSRYQRMSSIAEGDVVAAKYIAANATTTGNAQERLISNQFQQYFATLPPTQHVEDALTDITNQGQSSKYIEPILSGLRVLNQRGDTDLVKKHLQDALSNGQIELGTHASQSLANFLMFETKDSDFTLRRFGKYINLETARVFNEGQGINPETGLPKNRVNRAFDMKEYVTGEYIDYYDASGNAVSGHSKLAMAELLKGTPVSNIERTAFKTFDEVLKDAYGDDIQGLTEARAKAIDSLMPSLISAAQSFPSGSEQLVNLAAFITGLSQNSSGEWVKTYEKDSSPLKGLNPEEIRKVSQKYIGALTPAQVYGLRTDVLAPVLENFADEFEEHPTNFNYVDPTSKETINRLAEEELELNRQIASLDPNDPDTPTRLQSLKNQKKKVRKQRRDEESKTVFLHIMDDKDKLIQIYHTRRSGGGNNAKDIIRRLLNSDNESKIDSYLVSKGEEPLRRRKSEDGHIPDPDLGDQDIPDNSPYTDLDRQTFQAEILSIYANLADHTDKDAFWDQVTTYINNVLGPNAAHFMNNLSSLINPSQTTEELRDTIISALADPRNYTTLRY